MSANTTDTDADCTITAGCDAIELIIEPRAKDLGGFSVRRCLPVRERRSIGPWIFFDEMGLAHFPAGEGVNVRPHPHINLATVTYLFTGEILHRDSLGSYQAIRPGDINLMVAGKGIVHSERERPEINSVPHSLHGLQLWLALPEADEETEPAFYHYPSASIPALEIADVPVRVLIGSAYGVSSPVKTFFETLYIEADLKAGQQLILPNAAERGLYVAKGEISLQDTQVSSHQLVVLRPAEGICILAKTDTRIALVGGEAIGKHYIDWNFVSSSKARIEQAKEDWQAGRFPKVPGDEEEFIPLPG
ncbi:pirin family protein [Alishewanella longhuensis]